MRRNDRSPDQPAPGRRTHVVELAVQSRSRRTALLELPRLIADAFLLLWRASRVVTLTALVVQALTSLGVFAQVLLIKKILDAVLEASSTGGSIRPALAPVAALALLAAVTTVGTIVSSLQQRVLGDLVAKEVWRRTLDVTEVVDLASYEDPVFHDQVQRVTMSAPARTISITQGMVGLVGGAVGAAAGGVAVLLLAPILLPLLLVAGVPLLATSRLAARLEFDFAVRWSGPGRERVYLESLLTGREEAKEVRAFSLARVLRDRWEASYGGYIEALRAHVGERTWLALVGNGVSAVLTAATLLLVLLFVETDRLGLAQAGAALVAVRLLAGRVNGAVSSGSAIYESALFLKDLHDFLARRPEALSRRSTRQAPEAFETIRARDLEFTYPRADKPSLSGVNLEIRRGEVVALVGENGSGKTTLAKLLADLYEPDAGAVTWDDVDLREYAPETVRERIAVIFQDFVRYKLSARDNVALGSASREVADAAVRDAAQQAGAAEFLESLPGGYDTVLSTEFLDGADLSLGQWQRVALARAFVRKAPLVILDEPSASLDARAEHELFERIRSLLAGRTVLLISHRFSTVRTADRIYVLKDGRIVERGHHESLMADGGLYAELFTLQASAYAEPVFDDT